MALPLESGTKVLCYADDIAIITTGQHYAKRAQRAITAISNKCQELGLKINIRKTKTIYFGTSKTLDPIMLHDTGIE